MKAIKFIFWMLVCQLPALVSASVVQNNMGWYNALNQAPLSPPNSVFGIVWGFLYVLLGLCAFLAFGNGINNKNKIAVMCFISQLALNMCWTPVFFGRQNPLGALVLLAGMLGLALFQLDLLRVKICKSYLKNMKGQPSGRDRLLYLKKMIAKLFIELSKSVV